jgi:hypothetical protein
LLGIDCLREIDARKWREENSRQSIDNKLHAEGIVDRLLLKGRGWQAEEKVESMH